MKLKKEQMEAASCVATMLCVSYTLENLEDNMMCDLPDHFKNTKTKLAELMNVFNTDVDTAEELYVDKGTQL